MMVLRRERGGISSRMIEGGLLNGVLMIYDFKSRSGMNDKKC